jgi:hypothetical protein
VLATAGVGAYLLPLRHARSMTVQSFLLRRLAEGLQFGTLLYGSIRWRRILL